MRILRNILGSVALGALVVYTMRLPDHPKAPAVPSAVAVIPAPAPQDPTLIAGPAIGPGLELPSIPAKRTYAIDNCFSAEPERNIPVIWGPNAVITAALKQDWEVVRKLIDAGAPVESTNEKGLTALMVAAQHGQIEMMRMLLERQARIDFMDFEGRTAIHYAMAAGKRQAVELLLSQAPNLDSRSAVARDLLTTSLASGDMAIFQMV